MFHNFEPNVCDILTKTVPEFHQMISEKYVEFPNVHVRGLQLRGCNKFLLFISEISLTLRVRGGSRQSEGFPAGRFLHAGRTAGIPDGVVVVVRPVVRGPRAAEARVHLAAPICNL